MKKRNAMTVTATGFAILTGEPSSRISTACGS